jgi:hypothetical protein
MKVTFKVEVIVSENTPPKGMMADQLIKHIYSKSTQLIINTRINQPTTKTTDI